MIKDILSNAQKDYLDAIVKHVAPPIINTTVRIAFVSAIENREADRRKIFRETEDLLRAKTTLEENIEEHKKEIEKVELGRNEKRSSADIVTMATTRLTSDQLIESKILSLQSKIERDGEKINRLNKALKIIENDKWFRLIELKYFENWEDEELADEFGCDPRTVKRHKSRLVWRLAVKLTGGEMVG